MTIYKIEGKNAQGANGSWEIEAQTKDEVLKVIQARGITAEKIDGETVKTGKAQTPKEIDDGV